MAPCSFSGQTVTDPVAIQLSIQGNDAPQLEKGHGGYDAKRGQGKSGTKGDDERAR